MARITLFEVLKKVVKMLNQLRAEWCLCGGVAANYYGSPRATYDLDILLLLEECDIETFAKAIKIKKNVLCDIIKISNRYFLEIMSYRVDFWFPKSLYDREILKRRKKVRIDGLDLWIISVEDLIIQKLRSDRLQDIEDLVGIIKVNKKICWNYVSYWCKFLGIEPRLNKLLKNKDLRKRVVYSLVDKTEVRRKSNQGRKSHCEESFAKNRI